VAIVVQPDAAINKNEQMFAPGVTQMLWPGRIKVVLLSTLLGQANLAGAVEQRKACEKLRQMFRSTVA
jgi:hypothetical protein